MEKTLKEKIINLLSFTHGLSIEHIADEVESSENKIRETLDSLVSGFVLWKNADGLYSTFENEGLIYGELLANDKGFAFVKRLQEEGDDIYINEGDINGALHKDKVIIRLKKRKSKSAEGKVIQIVERGLTRIVGVYKTDARGTYILPDEKKLKAKVFVSSEDSLGAASGHKVVVEIESYLADGNMRGQVVEILGHENDPGVDILSIIHKHGINIEFSPETISEANAIGDSVLEEEINKRRDLRNELIITIDGEDAKDLDDAVSVKKLENGNYKLGVHIADVSHYITEGSALDTDAFERGTSVYLVDRVIPMIPHRLSNGICSLNPQVNRLTLSCEMEFDLKGNLVSYDIFESVIKTAERMTYSDVKTILLKEDAELLDKYKHITPMIFEMGNLANILRAYRNNQGSIDFDVKEAKILVDELCAPTEIVERDRSDAERLIEDFMLAANDTIAMHFKKANLPFIYRVHEKPSASKLYHFSNFSQGLGYSLKGNIDLIEPKTLQEFLEKLKGKKEETVISRLLLKSMQRARYSEESLGHFGLAKEFYTHFTSPIRRYPDLIVHRLIREYIIKGNVDEATKTHVSNILPSISEQTSSHERRAIDAERETVEKKKTEFMSDKVGESYSGIISSVTSFGMFVELPNTIEGLIHISSIGDDHYEFDEKRLTLTGKRKKKVYTIGDKMDVVLTKADLNENRIYFEPQKKSTLKSAPGKASRKNRFDSLYN